MATFAGIDLDQIKKLLSSGHSEKFIQEFFNISACTWSEWKRKNPAFKNMIVDWKADADENVLHALYQRAIGYTISEVVHFQNKKTFDVTPYENTKELPADVSACIHWLKKRKPEEWGDTVVPAAQTNVNVGVTLNVQQQDLDERIKQITFGDKLEDALR